MNEGDRVLFSQYYNVANDWAIVNQEPREGVFQGDYTTDGLDPDKPNRPHKASIVQTHDGGSHWVPMESMSLFPTVSINSIYEGLNSEEQEAFKAYKTSSYNLNDHLLGIKSSDESVEKIMLLDRIMAGSSNPEPTTLFRATQEHLLTSRIADGVLTYPAFLSTCKTTEAIQVHFSGHLISVHTAMIIHCPSNTNMVSLDIELFGIPEDELLLGRNHTFIVNSNQVTNDKRIIEYYMGRDYAQGVGNFRILELTIFD